MKMYILCELDDANYNDAEYYFFYTYDSAKEKAILDCIEQFEGDCEIQTEDDGFRITSSDEDNSFYVTEIKQIGDLQQGKYLLVWHHAYEGVNFEIRFQGSYEECEREMEKEIKKSIEDFDIRTEDVNGNVIDVQNEWQVWDIVEIV